MRFVNHIWLSVNVIALSITVCLAQSRTGTTTGVGANCVGCPSRSAAVIGCNCNVRNTQTTCSERSNNTVECTCAEGYMYVREGQVHCKDVNECELDPPPCGDFCDNKEGGYTCSCKKNRVPIDSKTCKDANFFELYYGFIIGGTIGTVILLMCLGGVFCLLSTSQERKPVPSNNLIMQQGMVDPSGLTVYPSIGRAPSAYSPGMAAFPDDEMMMTGDMQEFGAMPSRFHGMPGGMMGGPGRTQSGMMGGPWAMQSGMMGGPGRTQSGMMGGPRSMPGGMMGGPMASQSGMMGGPRVTQSGMMGGPRVTQSGMMGGPRVTQSGMMGGPRPMPGGPPMRPDYNAHMGGGMGGGMTGGGMMGGGGMGGGMMGGQRISSPY